MVVFAVFGVRPNTTGLAQLVPAEDPAVDDTEKPLSVATRPVGKFMTEPISVL